MEVEYIHESGKSRLPLIRAEWGEDGLCQDLRNMNSWNLSTSALIIFCPQKNLLDDSTDALSVWGGGVVGGCKSELVND